MTIQMSSLNPAVHFGAKESWGEREQREARQALERGSNSSHGAPRPGMFSNPGAFNPSNSHGNAPYLPHAHGGSPLPSGRESHSRDQYNNDTRGHNTGNAGGDPYFNAPAQRYIVDGDVPHKGDSKAYDLCSAPGVQLNGLFTRTGKKTWITQLGLVTGNRKLVHNFKSAPKIIEPDGHSTRMKRDALYELAPGIIAQWTGAHLKIQSPALEMDLVASLKSLPVFSLSEKSTFRVTDRDVAIHGLMGQTLTGKTSERRGRVHGPAAYLDGTGRQGEGVLETMPPMEIINGNLVGGLIGGEVKLSEAGDNAVRHYETELLEAMDPFSQFFGETFTDEGRYQTPVAEVKHHLFALA